MKIGMIVEILIGLRDGRQLDSVEDQAVIEACNLMDRLPRMEEAQTYEPIKN